MGGRSTWVHVCAQGQSNLHGHNVNCPDGKSWRDRRLCITDQEEGPSQLDREGGARKEKEKGSHGPDESNAPTRGQFRDILFLGSEKSVRTCTTGNNSIIV